MTCPYCQSEVGGSGICDKCGAATPDATTGWRPDPTGRHEGRYYIAGRPTNRVRNGRRQTSDPVGSAMLPQHLDVPTHNRFSVRSTWLSTGAAAIVIVMLALVFWALRVTHHPQSPPPEAVYLSLLHDAGLAGQFNSDANAIAHGQHVCRALDDGEPQQGPPADKIAVDAFCPHFTKGFHIYETAAVTGTFVLTGTAPDALLSSISSDGESCRGVNGYSDINRDTQVVVRNGRGDILVTAALGDGHGDHQACTFSFHFDITEGQDRYVVSVSHRGDFVYTFDQLAHHGVSIRLGD
jgi:hypothetical protein